LDESNKLIALSKDGLIEEQIELKQDVK